MNSAFENKNQFFLKEHFSGQNFRLYKTSEEFIELKLYEKDDEISKTANFYHCLNLGGLNEVFNLIEKAIEIFKTKDPNYERSSKVASNLMKAYSCCNKIYQDKKKK